MQFDGQVFSPEYTVRSHNHAAFDHVAQLTDVAAPRMAPQELQVAGLDRFDGLVHLRGKDVREMAGILVDIGRTFAERRQFDLENGEPVIEVFAEVARCDLCGQVAVGRGDNAHVDFRGFRFAYFDEFSAFEHPQQFCLQVDRHFTDLIEEERPAVGLFHQSLFIFCRSGKRSCRVSEQFAFEQVFRKCRAVDRYECPVLSFAGPVDRLCENLFAGARFARK